MGIDAKIFAVPSRTYLYFDRRHNLLGELYEPGSRIWHVQEVLSRHDPFQAVSGQDVLILVAIRKQGRAFDPDMREPNSHYLEKVEAFARAHPNDLFFVLHDHLPDDPLGYDLYAYPEKYGFKKWEPQLP